MDDPANVNLHVGANGRVPGKAPPNRLSIVGFLSGTATKAGKKGIVTEYKKKKVAKAALQDPAKVPFADFDDFDFLILTTAVYIVQPEAAVAGAALKAKEDKKVLQRY